jgi:hypothetical protein
MVSPWWPSGTTEFESDSYVESEHHRQNPSFGILIRIVLVDEEALEQDRCEAMPSVYFACLCGIS